MLEQTMRGVTRGDRIVSYREAGHRPSGMAHHTVPFRQTETLPT